MYGLDCSHNGVFVDHGIRIGGPHVFDIEKLGKSKADDERGEHDALLVHMGLCYTEMCYGIGSCEMYLVIK